MNDRYLYKAKRKNWRELPKDMWWVQGYYAYFKQNDNHCIYYEKDGYTLVCDIDVSTLCACTGLKDKTGKLIWENDIVECKYGTAVVEWNKAEWKIRWIEERIWRKDLRYWSMDDVEGVEIIGNIFDNQELLEVEE